MRLIWLLRVPLAYIPCLACTKVRNNLRSQDVRVFQHNQSATASALYATQNQHDETDTALSMQAGPPPEKAESVTLDFPQENDRSVSSEIDMKGLAMLEQQIVTTVKTHKLFDFLLVMSFVSLFCLMECGERKPVQADKQ